MPLNGDWSLNWLEAHWEIIPKYEILVHYMVHCYKLELFQLVLVYTPWLPREGRDSTKFFSEMPGVSRVQPLPWYPWKLNITFLWSYALINLNGSAISSRYFEISVTIPKRCSGGLWYEPWGCSSSWSGMLTESQ